MFLPPARFSASAIRGPGRKGARVDLSWPRISARASPDPADRDPVHLAHSFRAAEGTKAGCRQKEAKRSLLPIGFPPGLPGSICARRSAIASNRILGQRMPLAVPGYRAVHPLAHAPRAVLLLRDLAAWIELRVVQLFAAASVEGRMNRRRAGCLVGPVYSETLPRRDSTVMTSPALPHAADPAGDRADASASRASAACAPGHCACANARVRPVISTVG